MFTTKSELIAATQHGLQPKYLFFWGHHPCRDGSITKSCFSQWWESIFHVNGIAYPTAEHYMMAEKARLFGDTTTAELILQAPTPKQVKALGRQASGFNQALWDQKRSEIVVEGNYQKFTQNAALQDYLIKTGDRILVEASPVDKIWGIGLDADHRDASRPENWLGLNLLGFALMVVRERIRQEIV